MTDDTGQYRAKPAFNTNFTEIEALVGFAIKHFGHRPETRILFLQKPGTHIYSLMPWTQYRGQGAHDERRTWHILFHGQLKMLFDIARAIPPELNLPLASPEEQEASHDGQPATEGTPGQQ